MPRPSASVPPEAIRIEDEVWQEAFARREPAKPRPRLHAIDGGRPVARPAAAPMSALIEPEPATALPGATLPRTAAGQRTQALAGAIPGAGVPGRRTVTIRGYGAERNLGWPDGSRPRPQRRAYERAGFKPDRVALWAVLLGILLVVVAVASAHG